ncbi:MAG: hypothetical protein JXA66_07410, partial [Oligoflexia bacterium]|nr:hypothetical protein [Oligoflexia bacterium]
MSNYNLIENGNELIIEIKKSIDEDFIYPKEDKLSSFKTIIIDFNDVSKINSCGIREWIGFLSQIAGKTIIYRNCPKIIV